MADEPMLAHSVYFSLNDNWKQVRVFDSYVRG